MGSNPTGGTLTAIGLAAAWADLQYKYQVNQGISTMSLYGLGPKQEPFLYFDDFIPTPDWEKLHAEVSFGISQAVWDKKFVSSGVHPDYSHLEITPYMNDFRNNLTDYELQFFSRCKNTDERIKFLTALAPIPHPFWAIFLRFNRRTERTGIANKSVGDECYWTDNAVHFPSLVTLIKAMPFDEIGRVMLFMTEAHNQTVPHVDGMARVEKHDEFIWFNTKSGSRGSASKSMFVMHGETGERVYTDPEKRFIWFNEMDYHGTEPVDHFSFSIRIDGKFNQTLREYIQNR